MVDGFEKIRDPIYGGLTTAVDVGDRPDWITQDVGMWIGQTAYIELADGAVPDYHGATDRDERRPRIPRRGRNPDVGSTVAASPPGTDGQAAIGWA